VSIDASESARKVRVVFAGQTIAETRRALFLFETGLPIRYYIPPDDVRQEFLKPSETTSWCPHKGRASYWSLEVNGRSKADAVWSYLDPLPACPRIRGYFCFYPERVDALEVESEQR
jgi:uncharacterized protein (DUF427 family)